MSSCSPARVPSTSSRAKQASTFGKVKVGNDISLVAIAAIVSVLTLGTIEGIREGTLISALLTGIIARFYLRHLSRIDAHGRIYLAPHKS